MTAEEDIIKLLKKIAADPRFDVYIKQTIDENMFDRFEVNELKAIIEVNNKTIDEYRETVENRDKTIERRGDTIKKQHETINKLMTTIDELRDVLGIEMRTISDFKDIETKETNRLQKIIDDERRIFDEKDKSIGKCLRRIDEHLQSKARMQQKIDDLNKVIDCVEAELSVRKGDSEVLMKVVEIVKAWESRPMSSDRVVMNKISHIVGDYLDAPEPPIEEHYIIVDVNSVEDVKPIVEKIAKSVAALTGNHVNARVQFVTPDEDIPPIDDEKITVKVTSGTDAIIKIGWLELP